MSDFEGTIYCAKSYSKALGPNAIKKSFLDSLKGVHRAIILEKLIKHGRVDKRAIRLINQYIADTRVNYSREECDHLCRVMDNLMAADDADADIITGAMHVLRYCVQGASKVVKDGIIHKMVLHDL